MLNYLHSPNIQTQLIMLQKVINKIRHFDPGLFRLIHASKTLAAILISMLILYNAPLMTKVYAGMVAGFLMQSVSGDTTWEKLQTLLIAGLCFSGAYAIGMLVKPWPILVGVALAILAFFAMYVRRFGARYLLMPIFAWVFCYFAVVFPGDDFASFIEHLQGMITGYLVTAVIYLAIFPVNKNKQFYQNFHKFLLIYCRILRWLPYELRVIQKDKGFANSVTTYRQQLSDLQQANQTIVEDFASLPAKINKHYFRIYLVQSDLLKAMSIIFEVFERLHKDRLKLDIFAKRHIVRTIHKAVNIIDKIQINHDHITVPQEMFLEDHSDKQFQQYLCAYQSTTSELFVVMLNFNLGIQLLLQNLHKMAEV